MSQPHQMVIFLKITGVQLLALNRLHELLEGDSLLTKTEFARFKGYCGVFEPMKCVELLESKLSGSTYTIKLKILIISRIVISGEKECFFFTSNTILDKIFKTLKIMSEDERVVEIV